MPCTPSEVEFDGGYEVVCTFAGSPPDGRYTVYVGPLGTSGDPAGWGQLELGLSLRQTLLRNGQAIIVTPPLPIGTGYIVTLVGAVDDPGTVGTTITTSSLSVRAKSYKSRVYSMRGWLHTLLATGPRSVGEEPLQ